MGWTEWTPSILANTLNIKCSRGRITQPVNNSNSKKNWKQIILQYSAWWEKKYISAKVDKQQEKRELSILLKL